jgi:ectoine hydroxylase-related dioxygenase (phytanoyl-CoA dioxygenase family)
VQAAPRAELEQRGFCVLPSLVPPAQLARIAAAYDRAFAAGQAPDLRRASSGGDVRLAGLVNRSEFYELSVLEPVLDCCKAIIGASFKLSSFGGRTVLPGARAQPLHVDVRRDDDAWPLVGCIVMVDEFRAGNGATRFVPGSHLAEREGSAYAGNTRPERDAELACGPPGSVIVYHGSTWHGYSSNESPAPRRSIQGAYVRG